MPLSYPRHPRRILISPITPHHPLHIPTSPKGAISWTSVQQRDSSTPSFPCILVASTASTSPSPPSSPSQLPYCAPRPLLRLYRSAKRNNSNNTGDYIIHTDSGSQHARVPTIPLAPHRFPRAIVGLTTPRHHPCVLTPIVILTSPSPHSRHHRSHYGLITSAASPTIFILVASVCEGLSPSKVCLVDAHTSQQHAYCTHAC
ncbi:hypothetical protein BOTBODRAFT_172653 [Botryobasidium botryosum FD-172 SS1]|uniref:Uncharacterized protein n=1 Tax=Botryobasidium botryosum (strain FD-172 SS1) TaxID=930990 RepID=A0A067MZU9_BOTB1|nr:hypothetical protein BOTBODRAFT_172653 [Botryobasidium botryosum FD-172 SS1]